MIQRSRTSAAIVTAITSAACGAVLIASLALGLNSAAAHKGATGIVKMRMEAMKDIKDNLKLVKNMLKGKTKYRPGAVAAAAGAIKGHAVKMPKQFPEGSLKGKSEALPAVWERWQDFEAAADELARLAAELEASAKTNNAATRKAFAQLARSCTSCHDNFRKKK